MTENQLATLVFNCGMKVHKALGPGLLESAYEECLYYELSKHPIKVERQVAVPIHYQGNRLKSTFRADIVLEDRLLLELKCVNGLAPIHVAQTLTYLKMKHLKLGLLINFNEVYFKDGVRRIINGLI